MPQTGLGAPLDGVAEREATGFETAAEIEIGEPGEGGERSRGRSPEVRTSELVGLVDGW